MSAFSMRKAGTATGIRLHLAAVSPAGAYEGFRVRAEQLEAGGYLSDSHSACNALHLMGKWGWGVKEGQFLN